MATLDNLVTTRAQGDPDPADDQNNLALATLEAPHKGADLASANASGQPGTGNVAGTYANGTAGVGATITVGGTALTVDSVAVTNGMRVLLKDQSTTTQNGLYVASGIGSSVLLTRAPEANTPERVGDMTVNVAQGSLNGDTAWRCTTTNPTIGTTALLFRRATPFHGHGNPRFPWEVGGDSLTAPVVMATMPRVSATATITLPTTATHYLWGGIVIPAGRTVTNVVMPVQTAAATITIDYVSVVRYSDRTVLGTSTNNTTSWTSGPNIRTRALSTPFTVSYDTMVYVGLALASTTAAVIYGTPAFAQSAGQQARSPILYGTTTTPTTTPISGAAGTLSTTTLGQAYVMLT